MLFAELSTFSKGHTQGFLWLPGIPWLLEITSLLGSLVTDYAGVMDLCLFCKKIVIFREFLIIPCRYNHMPWDARTRRTHPLELHYIHHLSGIIRLCHQITEKDLYSGFSCCRRHDAVESQVDFAEEKKPEKSSSHSKRRRIIMSEHKKKNKTLYTECK